METNFVATAWHSTIGSYRTYEEWKPRGQGNHESYTHRFLPYLWGMETWLACQEIMSFVVVLTVPMRNGNVSFRSFLRQFRARVLTVPMRNGNNKNYGAQIDNLKKFLPYLWGMETVIDCPPGRLRHTGSYRTYEEWKLNNTARFGITTACSYRTYEEWKQWSVPLTQNQNKKFLPYLWGMETPIDTRQFVHLYIVLTVPMRNGNKKPSKEGYMTNFVLTVPMRNGNWQFRLFLVSGGHRSYRTYEEWKRGR